MVKNGLTKYQIDELSRDVSGLQRDMKLILENHLPHLKEDMSSLKTRINVLTILNVGSVILGLIIMKFLK